jgi:EmrB/QacA subfamily drug resistance transporter
VAEQSAIARRAASPVRATTLATRRGRLTLGLLCTVAFIASVPVALANVAIPIIGRDLHMSVQSLQWIPSAYLLTYGGFMLLSGRAADLIGRRRVLTAGIALFAIASLLAGFAENSGILIGARAAQGLGGAVMLPAALSILTTTFNEDPDRRKALAAWAAMIGIGSAGSLFGGLLVQGPGWRWVFLVLPPICLPVLAGTFWLLGGESRSPELAHLDLPGAILSTGGILLLVYALVRAPTVGWGSTSTTAELVAALVLLLVFVINEQHSHSALLPLSLFRIKGLAAADVAALLGFAGFFAVFYFLTLYMQIVLGYSPIKNGLAFLTIAGGVVSAARVASKLIVRIGTRPLLIIGAVTMAGGMYWLSRIPVHGSYFTDLFPGLLISSVGFGALSVTVTVGATAGAPANQAGLAAALLSAAQQVGGALGLAIFSAIASARTSQLLAAKAPILEAQTAGFQKALFAASIFVAAAAVVGTRVANTKVEAT